MFRKKLASDEPAVATQSVRVSGNQFRYKVNPQERLVTVKFGNRLTEDEIVTYVASVTANPRFDPKFSEIVDLSDVKKVDLHGEQMLKLADEVDPFSFDSKRAFVVTDVTQSHAARMHQILRTNAEKIRIFYSVAEAERWIKS